MDKVHSPTIRKKRLGMEKFLRYLPLYVKIGRASCRERV